MNENKVINRLNNISMKSYGGDALCDLEQPSAEMVQNSNCWFLQCFVLLLTTKQISSKNSGVRESMPFWGPFGERISTLHWWYVQDRTRYILSVLDNYGI